MNSDDNVMAQVLLAETMQGISTVSSSKSPDDYVVKYDGYYAINKELSAFLQEEKTRYVLPVLLPTISMLYRALHLQPKYS